VVFDALLKGIKPEGAFGNGTLERAPNSKLESIFRIYVQAADEDEMRLAGHGFVSHKGLTTTRHAVDFRLPGLRYYVQPALEYSSHKCVEVRVEIDDESRLYELAYLRPMVGNPNLAAMLGLKKLSFTAVGDTRLQVLTYNGYAYDIQNCNSVSSPAVTGPNVICTRTTTRDGDSGLPVFVGNKVRAVHYGGSYSKKVNVCLVPVPLMIDELRKLALRRKTVAPVELAPKPLSGTTAESPIYENDSELDRALEAVERDDEIKEELKRSRREGEHRDEDNYTNPFAAPNRSKVKKFYSGFEWGDDDIDLESSEIDFGAENVKAPELGRKQVPVSHQEKVPLEVDTTPQSVDSWQEVPKKSRQSRSGTQTASKPIKESSKGPSATNQNSAPKLKRSTTPRKEVRSKGTGSTTTVAEPEKPVLTRSAKRRNQQKAKLNALKAALESSSKKQDSDQVHGGKIISSTKKEEQH
jgi:hypothetical protein